MKTFPASRVTRVRFVVFSPGCLLGAALATLLWVPTAWYLLPHVSQENSVPIGEFEDSGVIENKHLPLPVNTDALTARDANDPIREVPHVTPKQVPTDYASDMKCYARGDESEICVYEHALCFDGTQVVVASASGTTKPYAPTYVATRPDTASCFDFRYYESSAPEYTRCMYLPENFGRDWRRVNNRSYNQETPSLRSIPRFSGNAYSQQPSGDVRGIDSEFSSRQVGVDWPIPFSSRRWGPGNRGEVVIADLDSRELFGPSTGLCDGCHPPEPPDFGPRSPGISHVSQFGETTATWLDGPLWIVGVNAQYHLHAYHMTTRLMMLFTAQLSNATQFGENPGDGYLTPFTKRSHPIEAMWRYKIPYRRSPERHNTGGDTKIGGFVEDADAPNRVQYLTGAQWDLPSMRYVAFAGKYIPMHVWFV